MKIYLVVRELYNTDSCDYITKVTPCLTESAAKRKLRESIEDELMTILHDYDCKVSYEDLTNGGSFRYNEEEKHYKLLKDDSAHLYVDFEIRYGSNSFEYHGHGTNSYMRIEEKFVEE